MSKPVKNIKHLKPRMGKKSHYKQGYFDVRNSIKYDKPHEPCIYRSSIEFKFMQWCERIDLVEKWQSEPFNLKYICLHTGNTRNYWIDFLVGTTTKEIWLVEVKSIGEVNKIKQWSKIYENLESDLLKKQWIAKDKTSATNYSKWMHAKQFCEKHGYRFEIVTENFFKKY